LVYSLGGYPWGFLRRLNKYPLSAGVAPQWRPGTLSVVFSGGVHGMNDSPYESSAAGRDELHHVARPRDPWWLTLLLVAVIASVVLGLITPLLKSNSPSSPQQPTTSNFNTAVLANLWRRGGLRPGVGQLQLIRLNGTISMEGAEGIVAQAGSADGALSQLQDAVEDDDVKGILLWINSPGGTVGMSQELHRAVARVSEKKPVVVLMGDVAASGGYMTACAADWVVAPPGALTGSIGVIMTNFNVQRLLQDKLGVSPVVIKSGQFKDLFSSYRPQSAQERQLLQTLVNQTYQQFLAMVLEGRTRHLKDTAQKNRRLQSLRQVADGRVLLGEQALKAGLIDQVGLYPDALSQLQKLVAKRFGVNEATVKDYDVVEVSTGLPSWLRLMEGVTGMRGLSQMFSTVAGGVSASHTSLTNGPFPPRVGYSQWQPLLLLP
jgi:signal peptide peptidase SppA